jgi:CRP-like cAMP-binding protein
MVSIDDLHTCELFATLSDADLEQIAAIAFEGESQPGDLFCAEREVADRLFILKSGRVQVRLLLRSGPGAGCEANIELAEPGRTFGWTSLVKQRRFASSVRVLEPLAAICIRSDDLKALFDGNDHIGFVVMKRLAEVIFSWMRHARETCEQPSVGPPVSGAG